ncbi:MAG TPA: hypothetical protein VMF51_05105 [Nocardioides sp.]|uniref:hypothetical protein n=1 Tax=Nocardioides sp. TaxID=35761 RepID=UPI002BB433AF|nr:hypothetical protein [Nocardioides sp.]HTW14486.1 hypothetical protein [Nocardioides sp.]
MADLGRGAPVTVSTSGLAGEPDPTLVCALAEIARGRSVPAAAAACHISARSLHRQLQAAKATHEAESTVQLVVKFVRAGLI